MQEKHPRNGETVAEWDESRIKMVLATARAQASWFGRRRGLSRADREDLAQDIVLALVETAPRYDADRGAFATFIAVVARRALIDRARRPPPPPQISLDAEDGRELRETLAAPDAEIALTLAVTRAMEGLPWQARVLLEQIVAHGDVVAAREMRAASTATFYRELHDLRCWLRASGAHPDRFAHRTRPQRARASA